MAGMAAPGRFAGGPDPQGRGPPGALAAGNGDPLAIPLQGRPPRSRSISLRTCSSVIIGRGR